MRPCGAGRGMRSRILVLGVLIAFALPCTAQTSASGKPAATAPPEFDLQTYQHELSDIEQAVKNGRGLYQLRRALPEIWTVRNGGQVYQVPTKEISEGLAALERNPKKGAATPLEARLRAMQQQAAELAHPSPGPNTAAAEVKLKKILARGEFQDASGPSRWEILEARLARWIIGLIVTLLGFLHISGKMGNLIVWAVILVAVVLLFYVVYGWLTKARKTAAFRAEVPPVPSDARHWLQEAMAAAERHNFREAVHCAYWAAVAHLEDIRVLPRDRSRTPRESLRLLKENAKELTPLQGITHSFELIWYGYRPASAGDWAGVKRQLEKMGCLQVSTAPTVPS